MFVSNFREVRRLNNRSYYLSKLVWVCIRYIQSGCVCFLSRIWSIWDKDRDQKIIHLCSYSYCNKWNGVWFSRVYPRYRYFSWTFLLSEVSYRTFLVLSSRRTIKICYAQKCCSNIKKLFYRFIGGILETAAWNAVTSILMALYPDKIASVMSWTQTFFGFGYMIGNKIIKF